MNDLREAIQRLTALENEPVRHRVDMHRLPKNGIPADETWEEHHAKPCIVTDERGVCCGCEYLRRQPPLESDCNEDGCRAFAHRADEIEEAIDTIVDAAKTLVEKSDE